MEKQKAEEREQELEFFAKAIEVLAEGQNAIVRQQGHTTKAVGDLGKLLVNFMRAMARR
jgi:hypothetical protein